MEMVGAMDAVRVYQAAESFAALIAKEEKRRAALASYRSLVYDPTSVYNDLLKPAPFKVYYGGRGAAKDWAFSEALLKRAAKESMLILCTREFQTSIADSVHRVLRQQIYRLGLEDYYTVTDKSIKSHIGGEFIFKGLHHNVEEIKSTEGVKITWVAEAQNTTDDSWRELLPTVFRQDDSELWVSFNVTDEYAATYKRFVTNRPEGSIVHKVNYTENPYFPKRLRDLMEADRRNDPEVHRHVWLGFPRRISSSVILGGRYIVETFADDLYKRAKRLFFGADFGFANDPSTLVRMFVLTAAEAEKWGHHIDPKHPLAKCDRLFVEYEAGGVGIELEEMPELYDSIPESRRWPIKADSARPETISFLKGKGFNISAAEKWKGSVEDGIAHLRSHLIILHPRCVQTESECGTYSYKVDPKTIDPKTNAPQVLPIIIDAHNHYIDAKRYGLDGYIHRRGGLATWEKLGRGGRSR